MNAFLNANNDFGENILGEGNFIAAQKSVNFYEKQEGFYYLNDVLDMLTSSPTLYYKSLIFAPKTLIAVRAITALKIVADCNTCPLNECRLWYMLVE